MATDSLPGRPLSSLSGSREDIAALIDIMERGNRAQASSQGNVREAITKRARKTDSVVPAEGHVFVGYVTTHSKVSVFVDKRWRPREIRQAGIFLSDELRPITTSTSDVEPAGEKRRWDFGRIAAMGARLIEPGSTEIEQGGFRVHIGRTALENQITVATVEEVLAWVDSNPGQLIYLSAPEPED